MRRKGEAWALIRSGTPKETQDDFLKYRVKTKLRITLNKVRILPVCTMTDGFTSVCLINKLYVFQPIPSFLHHRLLTLFFIWFIFICMKNEEKLFLSWRQHFSLGWTRKNYSIMRKRVRIYRKQMKRFTGGTHTHTFTHKNEEKEYKVATIFVTTPYDDVINEVLNGLRSPISLFFSCHYCVLIAVSSNVHVNPYPRFLLSLLCPQERQMKKT